MIKQMLAALVAASGLTGVAVAQTPQAAEGQSTGSAQAPICTLPKIADTAPLDRLDATDLVTVPVTINGATKEFLLDLSMNKPTEVSPAVMAQLGLPQDPKHTELIYYGDARQSGSAMQPGYEGIQAPVYDVRDNTGAASLDTRVRVGSLAIGGATDHDLQLLVAKKGEIGRSAAYDGFLTGDFFRQYDVELNFGAGQITWLTPTTCTDPDRVVFWRHSEVAIMPVSLAKDGRLQMQAMAQGHVINAEIDTSSPHTVMRRDIADLYVGLKPGKDMTPISGLKDGMGMQIYASTFPQIVFAGGGVTAVNVPVWIQDYSMRPVLAREFVTGHRDTSERIPDLVIGMDVLTQLHMYVVPGQGRVYVTSAE